MKEGGGRRGAAFSNLHEQIPPKQMRNLTLNLLRVTENFTSHDLVQNSRQDQAQGKATTVNHELLLGHSTAS